MANQISASYTVGILGDGVSTSVSFDTRTLPLEGNSPLGLQNPDSIIIGGSSLQASPATPTPSANVTSATLSGSVVTINFDSALVLYNPTTGSGSYTYQFQLGFNA